MFTKPWQDPKHTAKNKVDMALDILEPAIWFGDDFKLNTVIYNKG